MGFLQLVPATTLTATYDSETHMLVLRAQGQAQNYTTGIHFVPSTLPDARELFSLEGWVGPIGPGQTPYSYTQQFAMAFPGAFVLIADAEHPSSMLVPVTVTPGAAANAITPTETRRIAVGGVLELREAVWVLRGATQTLDQDNAFLGLESAGIQNPSSDAEIFWNLRGLRPGETLVKLLSSGGLAQIVSTRIIQVIIVPATQK